MFTQTWLWKHSKFFYKIPLYTNANVSIKPNWQGLVELANISQESEIQKQEFENDFDFNNSNNDDKLIQDILKSVCGGYLFYAGYWSSIRLNVCIYTRRVFTFLKTWTLSYLAFSEN